jgi:hypothetical protein
VPGSNAALAVDQPDVRQHLATPQRFESVDRFGDRVIDAQLLGGSA